MAEGVVQVLHHHDAMLEKWAAEVDREHEFVAESAQLGVCRLVTGAIQSCAAIWVCDRFIFIATGAAPRVSDQIGCGEVTVLWRRSSNRSFA